MNSLNTFCRNQCFKVTWSSPNVADWCSQVLHKLDQFALILQRAKDIVAYRIEVLLDEISQLVLCDLFEAPTGSSSTTSAIDQAPVSIDEFYARATALCERGALALAAKSENIEIAVFEIVKLLCPDYAELAAEFANQPAHQLYYNLSHSTTDSQEAYRVSHHSRTSFGKDAVAVYNGPNRLLSNLKLLLTSRAYKRCP